MVRNTGNKEAVGYMVESQRARMRSYRDLKVWQRAMDLTVRTYEITRRFPAEEEYGLVSQMRRAAASVPANIAEGRQGVRKKSLFRCLVSREGLWPSWQLS